MITSNSAFKKLVAKGAHPSARLTKDYAAEPVVVDGGRTLRFIVSTNAVDRDGDTIDQMGWDLDAYRSNPVVLLSHDQSNLPVGKAVSIDVIDGNLVATVQFVPEDVPIAGPVAEAVYQLCKSGFLSATSVGFAPIEYTMSDDPDRGTGTMPGLDHTRQQLLEFSIVTVPSNSFALIDPTSIGTTDEPDDVAVVAPSTIVASHQSDIAKSKRARALRFAAVT